MCVPVSYSIERVAESLCLFGERVIDDGQAALHSAFLAPFLLCSVVSY
jgi:hypothetical protein